MTHGTSGQWQRRLAAKFVIVVELVVFGSRVVLSLGADSALGQFFFHPRNQGSYISRLHEVFVDAQPDALASVHEIGIPRQDNRHAMRVDVPHRAHDDIAVVWPVDVQVG